MHTLIGLLRAVNVGGTGVLSMRHGTARNLNTVTKLAALAGTT